jgi:hypothetical protein
MIQQTQSKRAAKVPARTRNDDFMVLEFALKVVQPEGARKAVHRPPAEPSSRECYGCVEWFNYQQHPPA